MQPPNIPDWESMNFAEGDTREAIDKQNDQNAALQTFSSELVQYVVESGEALLTAGGKIFPTVAEGLAAAEDDGYFYAENLDPNISKTLYQRISASESRKVADDPSAELVFSLSNDLIDVSGGVSDLKSLIDSGDVAAFDLVLTDKDGFIALAIDKKGGAHCFSLNFLSGESINSDSNNAFSLADSSGNTPFSIGLDGVTRAQEFQLGGEGSFQSLNDSEYSFAIADKKGNIALGVKKNGEVDFIGSTYTANSQRFEVYEINHILNYGQSLSLGRSPALSTTQNFDNLMFEGGVTTRFASDNPDFYSSLVPHVEISRETPAAGVCQAVDELVTLEGHSIGNYTYKMMSTVDGDIGRSVTELSRGGVEYTRMMFSVEQAYALAQAQGSTYAVTALTYTQGERDYVDGMSRDVYKTKLSSLINDISVDVKSITRQDTDVAFISYQTGSHLDRGNAQALIALAQLDLENERSDYTIACPMYMFDYPDDVHADPESTKAFGLYYGIAYKRIVLDKTGFTPLKPIGHAVSGAKSILLRLNVPRPPLQFDTTAVTLNENYGFKLVDANGDTAPIDSVSIMSDDTLKIVSSVDIGSGFKLRYALDTDVVGGKTGRTDGARGNVRDSQGDEIVLDPSGINRRMDNWCLMFEIKL